MKRNMMAKITASIALLAIVLWIVGTSLLFIFWSTSSGRNYDNESITIEELESIIESSSGATQE